MSDLNANKMLDSFGGAGPPLLLVHGFGADRFSWLGTAPDLVKQASVYTIELPGHGNAWDVPADSGLVKLYEQSVAPCIENIVSQAGQPVHLVGHSLGGALAILAAERTRTQIASLSLIAPLGLGTGANTSFVTQFTSMDDSDTAIEVLQRTVFNKRLISSQLIQPLLTHLRKTPVRATLQSVADGVLDPGPLLTTAVQQIADSDLARQVIWGYDDNINPLAKEDADRFGGHWHLLEDCGHLPHIEHRTRVNQLLTDMVLHTTVV